MLWSGKQVLSSIIHNALPRDKARLSFVFKTATKVDGRVLLLPEGFMDI